MYRLSQEIPIRTSEERALPYAVFAILLSILVMAGCSDKGNTPDNGSGDDTTKISDCSVDIHQHLANNSDMFIAAESLISTMDSVGIKKSLLMPPPESGTSALGAHYDYTALQAVVDSFPTRLGLVGGGNILNSRIHRFADNAITPTAAQLDSLEDDARAIAAAGVAGFGEMAVLHLSYTSSHPFIQIPADHPMLLRLADVAAEVGLPIDIHLELVTEITLIDSLHFIYSNGNNPDTLYPNLAAFDSLLAHNRQARIVWVHAGWDNIGYMTTTLLRSMLVKHPNLYLGIKMLDTPGNVQDHQNRPLTQQGTLWPDWEQLIKDYPDRFLLGADEFFGDGLSTTAGFPSTRGTWSLLDQLPADIAKKIACTNPAAVYKLD